MSSPFMFRSAMKSSRILLSILPILPTALLPAGIGSTWDFALLYLQNMTFI
ncbi:MAG: hypothetical protein WCB31_06740 [Nitrososphaeraceae archaeon]